MPVSLLDYQLLYYNTHTHTRVYKEREVQGLIFSYILLYIYIYKDKLILSYSPLP